GLGSFKALGGAYAVALLALEEAGRRLKRELGFADLALPDVRAITRLMTFCCATDGNHGRSVAQGATAIGARSVIFMHARVTDARVEAIRRFGAEIRRVDGTYDASVAEAARVAEAEGWTLVSDTASPGYERIPALVMQGYTAIAREALDQLPAPPTHVFVQAGVGGIAAATAAHLAIRLASERPKFIVVEPALAACILASAKAGKPAIAPEGAPTVMAMLECYEPSLVAWRLLARTADAFMGIDDADAVAAMRRLAKPSGGDTAIVAGESGAAGLGGLLAACREPEVREALRLDRSSRVLLINTEGATDPAVYSSIVGETAEDVLSRNL
ncbi:MAG: diaminopropionate ammonia-lyase, partial [Proteobacteria bacterium]|nr:diaminopropionate ammonia-lyase [Pseudomonadota bacterium]